MTNGQEVNRLNLTLKAQQKILRNTQLEVAALKQQLHTDREAHQKEVALVREDAQIDTLNQTKKYADNIFEKDNRIKELSNAKDLNKSHQKLNGELQEKLSKYEDKAAHYRRKAIL